MVLSLKFKSSLRPVYSSRRWLLLTTWVLGRAPSRRGLASPVAETLIYILADIICVAIRLLPALSGLKAAELGADMAPCRSENPCAPASFLALWAGYIIDYVEGYSAHSSVTAYSTKLRTWMRFGRILPKGIACSVSAQGSRGSGGTPSSAKCPTMMGSTFSWKYSVFKSWELPMLVVYDLRRPCRP